MVVAWTEPSHNGACPLTGYSLLVDDGATGVPVTAVAGMATDVPTLRSASLTLTAADLGKTYAFLLSVSNSEGTTPSEEVSFLFAVSPSKPPSGPQIVSTGTSQISVRYDQALTSDGGSPVTNYHLQYMGSATGGLWVDLSGAQAPTLLTSYSLTGLVRGATYNFRYRVQSAIGWSDYSDEVSAVAAGAPSKPSVPPSVVGDPTATSVTLALTLENLDDGGSAITAFLLESCADSVAQDQCLTDAQFSTVASYASTAQHTLTAATDGLVEGTIYKFRYKATNAVGGNGPASESVSVAMVAKPAASTLIQKTMAFSSKTSLYLEWTPVSVAAAQLPAGDILGYVLFATDPETGNTWEAFNGVTLGLRDQVKANVIGLTAGKAYDFKVVAHNFNGAGTVSADFSFRSCILPSGFAAPTRKTSTATTVELEWQPPSDSGGCAITGYAVFKDDGTGSGTFAEVNTANDPALRGQPGLNSAVVTAFTAG